MFEKLQKIFKGLRIGRIIMLTLVSGSTAYGWWHLEGGKLGWTDRSLKSRIFLLCFRYHYSWDYHQSDFHYQTYT